VTIAPPRDDEELDATEPSASGSHVGDADDAASASGVGGVGGGGSDLGSTAAYSSHQPFSVPSTVPKALMQTREQTTEILTDPNDRGFFSATAKWRPATLMNGYTSGHVADYLRVKLSSRSSLRPSGWREAAPISISVY
jgi:hypothetical protein